MDPKTYRNRLVEQKKEVFKDPPVLPPENVEVLDTKQALPKRKPNGEFVFADHPKFRPNQSPKEVLQAGAFGGTYFRTITSAVTGETYAGAAVYQEFPADWFEGLDIKSQITAAKYSPKANKYGVKCGGSLGMWESSGWISHIDPYGWFQWYCRFFLGRRSSDDDRQISRWAQGHGPTGRWRVQLMNKIIKAGTVYDDPAISPVIRQVGLHWGYQLTQDDFEAYCKKKKIPIKDMKQESSDSDAADPPSPSRKRKAPTKPKGSAKGSKVTKKATKQEE